MQKSILDEMGGPSSPCKNPIELQEGDQVTIYNAEFPGRTLLDDYVMALMGQIAFLPKSRFSTAEAESLFVDANILLQARKRFISKLKSDLEKEEKAEEQQTS